ncbi:AAA domain-containing protein [Gemmatimonadota bacterium Y43]
MIESAVDHWKRHLIDQSRNNRLLYYKDLKTKTLRLESLPREADERLLLAHPVTLDELLPTTLKEEANGDVEKLRDLEERKLKDYRKRANAIFRAHQVYFEEQGLETLFLALGLAHWDDGSDENQRKPAAPILLVPIVLTPRGAGSSRSFTVEAIGEVIVNPVLLHSLRDLGVDVEAGQLLDGIEGMRDQDAGIKELAELNQLYSRLRGTASNVRDFRIADTRIISTFAYFKQAMVRDLEEYLELLVRHPIIGALAGDDKLQGELTQSYEDPEPTQFDEVPAQKSDLILDADSSQESAVRRILAEQSIVIQGPPGTGKSQTIANTIGAITNSRGSVLFVAEKRAAIQAVTKRLVASGLEHLILDLHGGGITRKALAAQIANALAGVKGTTPDTNGELYRAHDRTQAKLREHRERMHQTREPSGLSVYAMRGLMSACPSGSEWTPHLDRKQVKLLAERRVQIKEATAELSEFADLLSGETPTPWIKGDFSDPNFSFAEAYPAAENADRKLARVEEALMELGFNLSDDTTREQLDEIQRILTRHARTSESWKQSIWTVDLERIRSTLTEVGSGFFAHLKGVIANGEYRRTRNTLATHSRAGIPKFDTPLAEVRKLESAKSTWLELTGSGRPALLQKVQDAVSALDDAMSALAEFLDHMPRLWGPNPTWGRMLEDLDGLVEDRVNGNRLALYAKGRQRLNALFPADSRDLDELLGLPHEDWADSIDYALGWNAHREVAMADPAIEGFSGESHQQTVRAFQAADIELLPATAARVAREHGAQFIKICDQYPEEYAIIRREAEKKSRHKSLRQLMDEAPRVLTALFPCWMGSPLSVSQLLSPKLRFDVVLFDEASQIFPWDAVPSIMRGNQIVVAGDRHQMPPTDFFNMQDSDDVTEDAQAYEGFESLLAQAGAFLPSSNLMWHYRSEDERLIGFSNHHVYKGALITFPGAGKGRPPLRAEVVEDSGRFAANTRSGPDEVNRVVELIIEHAENHPEESLGVIAMGITHARRIEHALDQRLALRPDLEKFFDPSRESERFFVKNLERVQGDERDSIILSVGYAKNKGGTLNHNFGPITQEHGYRRLNVAVSRARRHMTVVSSFSWKDIDSSRSSARGVKFLRDFLRYAESGGAELADEGQTREPLNPWELEVYDRLKEAGLDLEPQYGIAKFRIDMVAKHPDRPGEFVLAIECDGASYHSSPTARERDRLRQQVLERLGWRFHRIWSTDWWNDWRTEVKKAVAAYEIALGGETAPTVGVVDSEMKLDIGGGNDSSAPSHARLGPKPRLTPGKSIQEYSESQLRKLAEWIRSDGKLRPKEELVEAMFHELGFGRRGGRIMRTLRSVVDKLGEDRAS